MSRLSKQDKLEEALLDLYNNVGGHDHWDAKGTSGTNCPVCITQRAALGRVRPLVHEIRDKES